MADERQYQQPTRRSRTPGARAPARKEPRALTPAEREKVAQTRADVHEHFPELIPTIKEFADAGLIDGWRNVTIKVTKNGTD